MEDIMEDAQVVVRVQVVVQVVVHVHVLEVEEQDAREKIFTEQNFIRKIFTMH